MDRSKGPVQKEPRNAVKSLIQPTQVTRKKMDEIMPAVPGADQKP